MIIVKKKQPGSSTNQQKSSCFSGTRETWEQNNGIIVSRVCWRKRGRRSETSETVRYVKVKFDHDLLRVIDSFSQQQLSFSARLRKLDSIKVTDPNLKHKTRTSVHKHFLLSWTYYSTRGSLTNINLVYLGPECSRHAFIKECQVFMNFSRCS